MMNTRTDWSTVITDIAYLLGDADPSNPAVRIPVGTRVMARALGLSREALRMWLDGSEPGHKAGENLIEHWCRLTGRARTFVPRTVSPLSAARAGGFDYTRSTDTDCTT